MGAHHGWRLFAAVFMTTLQKAQRSWRCRGFCGLVGLGWEHAKNMCICIPPSKAQRDINPTQDTIYTLAWVLVNLQATCDLS